MKTWVRKTLSVGVLAAGALLFGSGVAHADTHQNSWDNDGIANGTQVVSPIRAVTNVAGVGAGILGQGTGTAVVTEGRHAKGGKGGVKQNSSDNDGILNGTQIYLPIDLDANLCGIGIGLVGQGTGAAACSTESGHVTEGGHAKGGVKQNSSDNDGILNGTQIYLPIDADTNVCGVGIGLVGEGNGGALCTTGGKSVEGAKQDSSDNDGILNGTQIIAPIDADTNVCGIGVGVIGEGNGGAVCATDVKGHGDDHGGDDDGDNGDDGDEVDGDSGTDNDYGDAPRQTRTAADTEASPVSGVTDVTKGLNANGLDLGGLLGSLR